MVCGKTCKEQKKDSKKDLKNISLEWSGVEPYGEIYGVHWKSGLKGNYTHKLCRLKLVTPGVIKKKKPKKES